MCEFMAQKRTVKRVSPLMDLLLLIREALTKIGHYISGSLSLLFPRIHMADYFKSGGSNVYENMLVNDIRRLLSHVRFNIFSSPELQINELLGD